MSITDCPIGNFHNKASINNQLTTVQLTPNQSEGFNPAFDVTPARLVTALITERGVAAASETGLMKLYCDD